jgi:hypothetical protein
LLPANADPLQDVTQNWNDAWVEAGEGDVRYFHALLGVTGVAYAGEQQAREGSMDSRHRAHAPALIWCMTRWQHARGCATRAYHLRRAVRAAACATIAGLLYHFFAPSGADCSLNICLITLALVLCIVLTTVTLHPAVSLGLGRGRSRLASVPRLAPGQPLCRQTAMDSQPCQGKT